MSDLCINHLTVSGLSDQLEHCIKNVQWDDNDNLQLILSYIPIPPEIHSKSWNDVHGVVNIGARNGRI